MSMIHLVPHKIHLHLGQYFFPPLPKKTRCARVVVDNLVDFLQLQSYLVFVSVFGATRLLSHAPLFVKFVIECNRQVVNECAVFEFVYLSQLYTPTHIRATKYVWLRPLR